MEKNTTRLTKSPAATRDFGMEFSELILPGDIISLSGDLGSGKTTFVQGVALGLDIKRRVISPTFTLIRTYKGEKQGEKLNIYHVDLYRIENKNGIAGLGLEEIFEDKNGIFLIEWAERFDGLKPDWKIDFKTSKDSHMISVEKNE